MASKRTDRRGRLRIGDHGSAISVIALSQDNPLKAVAEFVENSIDARARNIEIVRGRERSQPYLKITDDGDGLHHDKNRAAAGASLLVRRRGPRGCIQPQ